MEVSLDEEHAIKLEAMCCGHGQLERCARQIGADYQTIRTGQIQAHLPSTTANLQNPRITGNSLIEEPCELVALGAGPERRETVVLRVAGKRRVLVKAAHDVNPRVTSDP